MWQTRWRKVENHGLEWKPLETMILNGSMEHRYQPHFLHGLQENQTTLEWRIVPTCNNRYFSPPQRGMRKNYIVFKGLWWNWIPVLVRSFSLKSIKERVLFWLGGDSFAVFTNLVNNNDPYFCSLIRDIFCMATYSYLTVMVTKATWSQCVTLSRCIHLQA